MAVESLTNSNATRGRHLTFLIGHMCRLSWLVICIHFEYIAWCICVNQFGFYNHKSSEWFTKISLGLESANIKKSLRMAWHWGEFCDPRGKIAYVDCAWWRLVIRDSDSMDNQNSVKLVIIITLKILWTHALKILGGCCVLDTRMTASHFPPGASISVDDDN